jgi:hypothetical protein
MSDLALYASQEISVFRPPAEVLEEARNAARALKDVVQQTNAVIRLGNSEHLKSEAWQTLGHFYGLGGRIKETRFVQYGDVRGFEAFAELVHIKTGNVVSTGEAMCLSDEEKWSARTKYEWQGPKNERKRVAVGAEQVPLFQLRSMAQTRALSKAHANGLKWVVVLAGYNPTPAEEVEGQPEMEQERPMPQRKSITEDQFRALYAKGAEAQMSESAVNEWLAQNSIDPAKKGADITPARYPALLAVLEKCKETNAQGK